MVCSVYIRVVAISQYADIQETVFLILLYCEETLLPCFKGSYHQLELCIGIISSVCLK